MDPIILNRVREVFEQTYLMTLATQDDEGVWASDVIFVTDEVDNIFWMSKPGRRHSLAIASSPQVALTMSVTRGPEDTDFGVQISGRAERVETVDFELVKKYFRKRNKPEPLSTDDVLGEHAWYRLVPDRIELIDGKNFGYDRQTVMLSTETR